MRRIALLFGLLLALPLRAQPTFDLLGGLGPARLGAGQNRSAMHGWFAAGGHLPSGVGGFLVVDLLQATAPEQSGIIWEGGYALSGVATVVAYRMTSRRLLFGTLAGPGLWQLSIDASVSGVNTAVKDHTAIGFLLGGYGLVRLGGTFTAGLLFTRRWTATEPSSVGCFVECLSRTIGNGHAGGSGLSVVIGATIR
ncbi:hypothetical protein Rhom172_2894 (plasmid) [Rhodothermus marinus SG0.5JP17-172]|uniref:hypothetical protein n=1 Tax=Rhodothermus marinus TaxID=29549 RepID=UPI000223D26F|nr:hypothetical protein [Rhodothermus marinus]AEN74771.1 hypothetical protein Rhom172_2894 [Rhodothermus marinus SG0.5JP17-172]